MSKYDKCVQLLTSKEKFHIELGLNRISKILNILNNPQDKIKTIHIAGTNGKGSTCAILNSILSESGYKTGLFTSPHLEKYNERIQINTAPARSILRGPVKEKYKDYFDGKSNSYSKRSPIRLIAFSSSIPST